MQQGGGICPQILRISHEYHIKAFKIVKKNQLVTRQKINPYFQNQNGLWH